MQIWSAEIKEIEKYLEAVKDRFPELEKELKQLVMTDDPNVLLLYSRRCLEVIITDLYENELRRPRGTEPLKGIIDKLSHDEKVPSHIKASMDGVNTLSTFGTHPKDFDPEQVKPVLNNLSTVLKWYLKYKGSPITTKTRIEESDIEAPWNEFKKEGKLIEQQKLFGFNKFKLLSGILSAVILLALAGVFVYPKIFQVDTLRKLRTSGGRIALAVIPFQNMSNDSTLNYLKEWIPESIVSYLSNFSEDLQVRQPESIYSLPENRALTNNASLVPSITALISQKLDADVIISGSMTKTGTGIIVKTTLINTKTEEVLRSYNVEGNPEVINPIIDSLSQKIKDYLIVSRMKKGLNPEVQSFISTSSPEALKHYILGKDANSERLNNYDLSNIIAHEEFLKAVRIDSNFIAAYLSLIDSYTDKELYDSAKFYCLRLYVRRNQMPPQLKLQTEIIHSGLFRMPYDCIKYLNQLLELDDQQPGAYFSLGNWYRVADQPDKAISVFEKSLEIYNKWGVKPPTVYNYIALGETYCDKKLYKKAERLYKKAERDFLDNQTVTWYEFQVSVEAKDMVAEEYYLKKFITLARESSRSEFYIAISIANVYEAWGYHEKAEEYIRKALILPPDSPVDINVLAWSLIDFGTNINEGLELADKALELDPHYYPTWDTKGWGLYKQGKYKEALVAFQKADSIAPKHDPEVVSHIQRVKKAISDQKNN